MKRHFFDESDLILLAVSVTMVIVAAVMSRILPL